jgi:hypothetical protein
MVVVCLAAQVLCMWSRMALCGCSSEQVKVCSIANLPCAVCSHVSIGLNALMVCR